MLKLVESASKNFDICCAHIFQGFQVGEVIKRPSIFQRKEILKNGSERKYRSRDWSPQPLRASAVMFVF